MSAAILPRRVTDADLAFPTSTRDFLPAYDEIPAEFRRIDSANKWSRLVSDWFFAGVKLGKLTPKDGIDAQSALRHVGYCMRSWEPKHEHKEAGVAYLLSLWFDDIEYTKAVRP